LSRQPLAPRASVYIDGQNLYFAARDAFGHRVPNYDPTALATLVCTRKGWTLANVHFYTGIPSETDSPDWHLFWKRRLTVMGTRGVETCSRPLSYQTHRVRLSDGTIRSIRIGREKGIDVRLALDIVRMARAGTFDVAIVFSQDQDLAEVATELRAIAPRRLWRRRSKARAPSRVRQHPSPREATPTVEWAMLASFTSGESLRSASGNYSSKIPDRHCRHGCETISCGWLPYCNGHR
jgi:uncharacterized LabA/DUF88 family protein